MNEDKQIICNLLCATLKATNAFHKLHFIRYTKINDNLQLVTLTYQNGNTKTVEVTRNTGAGMLRDILKDILAIPSGTGSAIEKIK